MWDKLKSAGVVVAGIAIFIGLLLLSGLFIYVSAWVGEKIYPWLAGVYGLTFGVVIFVLLPFAFFRKTRVVSGIGMMISSYVFGLTLWVWGLLLTYNLWGFFAVFIGLFIFGVGVVPIAMLATLFKGMWPTLGDLVLLTVLTFGTRFAGVWITSKAKLDQTKADQVADYVEAHAAPDVAAAVSTTTLSAPPSVLLMRSNYFVRHWRGDFSLGIAYWINGAILAGVVPAALIAAVNLMVKGSYSLRTTAFASLGVLLFSVIAWLWSIVGIWRSANHHVARGGSSRWASAARLMVVLGIIGMAGQLPATILPQIKEFALIASGNDPIGNIEIKVAQNGQSVIVNGMLREGAAAEVQKILDAAPGATSLVLNLAGGRLLEAQQLARAVGNRNLDTYVEDQCVSACTYVFLAGKDRAATPKARIGFHQPSFPGMDASTQRSMTQDMLDVYRSAGLPEAFIQHIGRTPSEEMWYPTRDELIASHVITRVSLGGEAAISGLRMRSKQELLLVWGSIPLYQALEKRFPGTINENVERAWAAKERGGNDADIMNAARSVVAEVYPKVLKTADVSILDDFVKLMITEMSAALAISGDACAKLLDGKLDLSKTLPKEIVEQEQQLLLRALASPPRTDLTPPDPAKFNQVAQMAFANLPQRYINVVTDAKTYASQPSLVCDAMIAYFSAIAELPPRERHVALRGMYQGDN